VYLYYRLMYKSHMLRCYELPVQFEPTLSVRISLILGTLIAVLPYIDINWIRLAHVIPSDSNSPLLKKCVTWSLFSFSACFTNNNITVGGMLILLAVAQLVEALRYKPGGRGFDS
jgi:hypothetical protein